MEQAAVLSIGLDPATIREVKRHSGWFITLGVALIVLGVIALGAVGLVTLASVLLFGWLLVIGGIMHSVHAFHHPWGGFTRHLLGGILSLVVGLLIVANPAAGALSLTLLLAALFMGGGIFRIADGDIIPVPGTRLGHPRRSRDAPARDHDLERVARIGRLGHRDLRRHRPDLRQLVRGGDGDAARQLPG